MLVVQSQGILLLRLLLGPHMFQFFGQQRSGTFHARQLSRQSGKARFARIHQTRDFTQLALKRKWAARIFLTNSHCMSVITGSVKQQEVAIRMLARETTS